MTEEMNLDNQEKECKCLCCSKEFKKFLIISAGTFVGVFCALSLFAALHKPPMFGPCPFARPMMVPPMHKCHHFDRGKNFEFNKMKFEKRKFDKDIPVRIEVENHTN